MLRNEVRPLANPVFALGKNRGGSANRAKRDCGDFVACRISFGSGAAARLHKPPHFVSQVYRNYSLNNASTPHTKIPTKLRPLTPILALCTKSKIRPFFVDFLSVFVI